MGRRAPVDHAVVGDSRLGLAALLPLLQEKTDRDHLEKARKAYEAWGNGQQHFTDPDYDHKKVGLL